MKQAWPLVRLGDVLLRHKDGLDIEEEEEYTRLTIRMNGQGVGVRDKVCGREIGTKRQFRVKAGQFLLSKIDARNGAFGLVPNDCDEAIVTGNFWAFDISSDRVLPRFIDLLTKTTLFVDYSVKASSGTTNRLYLQEEKFVEQKIELPPIEEQEKIVARIDIVQQQLRAAEKLRKTAYDELQTLCRVLVINDPSTKKMTVADLVKQRSPDVNVEPDVNYQFAGVYSFGRGVFKGGVKTGAEFAYPKLSRIKSGDFIYPKLMAWEGALGVVPDACDGCVVSPEFPVFEIDQSRVLPDVFDVYFRDPNTWESLQGGSTGTNARRRRLNPADFLKLKIPVPSMVTQQKLAAIRSHQRQIQGISADTECSAVLASLLNKMLA
ncbi:MAG: restriction endonuclease subunit S [Burkholderiaceae bacterium]|nr:restriction endonuclease subunit S [Burkholderiaceae bacterium]